MNQISIAVPNDPAVLRAAAGFFKSIADDTVASARMRLFGDGKHENLTQPEETEEEYKVRLKEVERRLPLVPYPVSGDPAVAEKIDRIFAMCAASEGISDDVAKRLAADGTAPLTHTPCTAEIAEPLTTPPAADVFAKISPSGPTTAGMVAAGHLAPPSNPGIVTLDSEGLPWDHRIHSSSKAFLSKGGGWKKLRGVDPALVATVEAELRAAMGASGPIVPPAPVAPPPPTGTCAPGAYVNGALVTPTAAPIAPPPAPVAPAPAAPAKPAGAITWPVLMAKITERGITKEVATAAANAVGIATIPLLTVRPDLVPQVYAILFPGE